MNDTELDDMLNKWDAPPLPRGLRERISQEPPRKKWKLRLPSGLFFGLATGAAMFLLAVGIASPQSLGRLAGRPIPFLVYSEYISHNADGSTVTTEYARTFERDGHEWVLDATFPGSTFQTVHMKVFSTLHLVLYEVTRPLHDTQTAGKICEGSTGDGHETLLGYQTTIISTVFTEGREKYRFTKWEAPMLACATLKTTYEQLRADGSARLVDERRALNVIINHAQ